MLSNLSGRELKQVNSMLAPLLPPWFDQFGKVLGSSADVQVSPIATMISLTTQHQTLRLLSDPLLR